MHHLQRKILLFFNVKCKRKFFIFADKKLNGDTFHLVDKGFKWSNTPEGHEFWSKYQKLWSEECEKIYKDKYYA